MLSVMNMINCERTSIEKYEFMNYRQEGESPLHQAVAENRRDIMMSLLQKGADINARSSNGSTILHVAAERGDVDAVKFIINNGINVGSSNNDGLTALHLAAINNHRDVMSVLLANGADVNARASDGSTLLHLAVANNMLGSVEFILQSADVLMSPKNNDLFTPLILAERLGRLEIASVLREKIGNISVSTLYAAVKANNLAEVKSLVLKGADVNGLMRLDIPNVWVAPLHGAACNGYTTIDTVKFLVEHGAEVNIKQSPSNITPLYDAAFCGNLNIAKYLVENGAEVNVICNNGKTPLSAATGNNYTDVATYLRSVGGEM